MANTSQSKQAGKNQSAKKYSPNGVANMESSKTKPGSGTKSSTVGKVQQKTLKDLFHDGLKDVYSAEKQLLLALPKMAAAADNEELQEAFSDHLEQTKKHVQRLEKIMQHLGVDPGGETCEAMEGLIKEGEEIIQNYPQSAVRDSALIIGAQKVEHYEIASYGSLCELADVLGLGKIHDTLGRTLDEEEDADSLLSEIAQDVNDEAHEGLDFKDEDEDLTSSKQ